MNTHDKIYVAGHTGLLGSAVLRALQRQGYTNIITATHAKLDLTDQRQTHEFIAHEQPGYVFLCAAKVGGIQANIDNLGSFLYINLQIQNNVIEASRIAGVKKLLFVGSSCIYPRESPCPIKEEYLLQGPLEPTNEGYAVAKLAGIKMCQFYRRQYGCDFISAIPTNLFGINDHYDLKTSHLMPALIMKVHQAKLAGNKKLELWGSGKPRREFMLSDDCAEALVFLMNHYSAEGPVNVGTGEDKTVLELAETVARVLNCESLAIQFDPTKPDGMMRKVLDVSKLTALGWRSQIAIEAGIKLAYDAFAQAKHLR